MDFNASAVQSATIQPESSVLKGKPPCKAWGLSWPGRTAEPVPWSSGPPKVRAPSSPVQGPSHPRCSYSFTHTHVDRPPNPL